MEDSRIVDILMFSVLSVTVLCLSTTAVLQHNLRKEISALRTNCSDSSDEITFTARTESSYENTTLYFEETVASETITEPSTTLIYEYNTAENTTAYGYIQEGNSQTPQNTRNYNLFGTANGSQPQTTAQVKTTVPVTEKSTQLDSVFVYSKNSKKLHSRNCPYAVKIKEENKRTLNADLLQEYLDKGYTFCSHCHGYIEV